MKGKSTQTKSKTKAQGMVEFAIALPILMIMLYGMLEAGRAVFIYSTVVTAAREAVRYGSAMGIHEVGGVPGYQDCAGIMNAAERTDFLNVIENSNITIQFDKGPGTATFAACPASIVVNGDRISVQVSAPFALIVPIVPLQSFTFTSSSSRTILASVNIY
ncbi:MAG: TadE family protein [Chloroflexota bacterium]